MKASGKRGLSPITPIAVWMVVCAFVIAFQGDAHGNQCLEFSSDFRARKQDCADAHSPVSGDFLLKVASPVGAASSHNLFVVLGEKWRDAKKRGISDEQWFLGLLTDPTLGAAVAYHRLAGCTKCKLYGILAFDTGEMYFFGKDGVRKKGIAASSWDGMDIKRVGDKHADDIRRIFADLGASKPDGAQKRLDRAAEQASQAEKLIYKPPRSAKSVEITDALASRGMPRAKLVDALHAAIDMHKEFSIPFLTDPGAYVQVSSQGWCYGQCPVFEAVIHQDGQLEFWGIENTRIIGQRKVRLSQTKLDEIQRRLQKFDVFGLDDQYARTLHDSVHMISVQKDGKSKHIIFKLREAPVGLRDVFEFLVETLKEKQLC